MILAFSFVWLAFSASAFATGDCNVDNMVTIAEVQSAINMFLGLKTVENCVDEDHDGKVSIAEVQKTINSFLGLDAPQDGDTVSTLGSYGAVYSGIFVGASVTEKPPYTKTWRMNASTIGSISGHTDNDSTGGQFVSGSTISGGAFTVAVPGGGTGTNGDITLTGTLDVNGNVSGTWVLQTNTARKGTFTGTKEIIPDNRFTIKANGTVYDSYRNLTWLKYADCFVLSNWSDASAQVSTLQSGVCGLSDGSAAGKWRLPTTAEMVRFLDEGFNANTLMDPLGFTNVQSIDYYLSYDSILYNTKDAWSVNLLYGNVDHLKIYDIRYVWAVHTGQ
jgi:hypothetical protein